MAPVAEQLVRLEGDAKAGKLRRNIVIFRGLALRTHRLDAAAAGLHVHPGRDHAAGGDPCRRRRRLPDRAVRVRAPGRHGASSFAADAATTRSSRTRCATSGAGCVKIGEPENAPGGRRRDLPDGRVRQPLSRRRRRCIWARPACGSASRSGNTVSHNEISGPLMWAISAGWTWSYFPLQRARDNVIEFNHVPPHRHGLLGSHCAIYALGTSPGTVIRNNYIHHVFHSAAWRGAGEGIILDNGCCGILVENNVVHDAVAGGFGTNFNCFGNIILNNIFAYGTGVPVDRLRRRADGPPQPKGEIFARNIVVWKEGPLIKEADWPNFTTLWDYNLYCQRGRRAGHVHEVLAGPVEGQGAGRHSIVADPLFVDASKRNFALRPDSPALRLGFRPIDLSRSALAAP